MEALLGVIAEKVRTIPQPQRGDEEGNGASKQPTLTDIDVLLEMVGEKLGKAKAECLEMVQRKQEQSEVCVTMCASWALLNAG